MKKLIIILILCISAQTINAKPMWEISSKWVCNLEFNTNMLVDNNTDNGEQLEKYRKNFPDDADKINGPFYKINQHEPWTFFLDFKKSILIDQTGYSFRIYDKHYYGFEDKRAFNNKNILVIKSNEDEKYPWHNIYVVEEFKVTDGWGLEEYEYWAKKSFGPRHDANSGVLELDAYK